MDAILDWIKGIIGCLLIMSLILQCMPGKIYRPYLRLFMGIVLILTMLGPLTEIVGVGETLETLVGELAFEDVSPDWEEKLLEADKWTERQIVAKAEEMSGETAASAENVGWVKSGEKEDVQTAGAVNGTEIKIEIETIAAVGSGQKGGE